MKTCRASSSRRISSGTSPALPVEVAGRTAFEAAFAAYPGLRGYVLDEAGSLRQHMTVFVDGVQVPRSTRSASFDAGEGLLFRMQNDHHAGSLGLMEALVAAACLLLAGGCLTAPGPSPPEGPLAKKATEAKLAAYLNDLSRLGFSGVVLVEKHGDVVLHQACGWADRARKIPVTLETQFPLASASKQFTAAAILKLEMAGLLSENDPLKKFFDDVPADKADITLHQLMNSTSGLPVELDLPWDKPVNRGEMTSAIFSAKLSFKPGSRWQYSNPGFELLTAVIERVSHQSCADFMQATFFSPLGMSHTGWEPLNPPLGYLNHSSPGGFQAMTWPKSCRLLGAGGVSTTVSDLQKWMHALKTSQCLNAKAKEALWKPVGDEIPEDDCETRAEVFKPVKNDYTHGWIATSSRRGTKVIYHPGGTNPGYNSMILWYPDDDFLVISLSNSSETRQILFEGEIRTMNWGLNYALVPNVVQILLGQEVKLPLQSPWDGASNAIFPCWE